LNYCGLGAGDLVAIGDRNPEKDGLVTPERAFQSSPKKNYGKLNSEYLFVLIWHFRKEVNSGLKSRF